MDIKLVNTSKCTGCAACSNICSKDAIEMIEDKTGFVYPVINKNKCVKCGTCLKVCPVLNKYVSTNHKKPIVYGAKCKNSEIRFKSTSGGIFAVLANSILKNEGVVAGAIYETPYCVKHSVSYNVSQLETLLQSKYVQSNMGYVYREVSENLKKKKHVLFCGTPCQVAGLYSFLNRKT